MRAQYVFTQEKEKFAASYSRYFAIAKIAASEEKRFKEAKFKDIEELEDFMIVFRYVSKRPILNCRNNHSRYQTKLVEIKIAGLFS